jgi:hypothetical protein
VFKYIIDICMDESLHAHGNGREYVMLQELLEGKGSVGDSLKDLTVSSPDIAPWRRSALQLRALLDMLKLLQGYCNFGTTAVVHEVISLANFRTLTRITIAGGVVSSHCR